MFDDFQGVNRHLLGSHLVEEQLYQKLVAARVKFASIIGIPRQIEFLRPQTYESVHNNTVNDLPDNILTNDTAVGRQFAVIQRIIDLPHGQAEIAVSLDDHIIELINVLFGYQIGPAAKYEQDDKQQADGRNTQSSHKLLNT